MKAGRLLLALIFIIAILTTSSLAAIRTVTYYSELFTNQTEPLTGQQGKFVDWTDNHTLPYFNPAMGWLLSVDFRATLNGSLNARAENLAATPVTTAYTAVNALMNVTMINGKLLPLDVLLRIPESGYISVSAYDGTNDLMGPDSYNGTDADNTTGSVHYSDNANVSQYIGVGTFLLLAKTHGVSDVSGGGTWDSRIRTTAWSYAAITYTYNDEICLSGYKKDGCTGLPLSGWNITVSNSSLQLNATTNSSGFWQVCNLTPGR
jgi:hypothetical protein